MATDAIAPPPQLPSIVESGFGRFFFGGRSVVYFSPLVRSIEDIGRCYQVNDPVSDDISDILATDGGEIPIDGAGNITALRRFRYGVLVFANNGVWFISGPDGIFSATNFSVTKVTDRGCTFPNSIVLAESVVYYFSTDGIIQLSENEFNVIVDQDITRNTIRTHYLEFYDGVDVAGGYKPETKEIWWWQKERQNDQPPMREGGLSTSKGLVLDLKSGGFYPQQTDQFTSIATPIRKNSDFYHTVWSTTQASVGVVDVNYQLRDLLDENFTDGTVPPYTAYMETGDESLGKFVNGKGVVEANFVFQKTETVIEDYNWQTGVYTYDKPSGCLLQIKWDYDGTAAGNRWVGNTPLSPNPADIRQINIYNPNVRGFVPDTIPSPFDDGYTVVNQRQRLRGHGKAVKFRFESKDNEDMQMLGYSVAYSLKGRM